MYKQIRDEDPVYFSSNGGFWFLSKYEDVASALEDRRLSSDRTVLFSSQLGNLSPSIIRNFSQLTENSLVENDPPQHTSTRKVSLQGFTARALESWRSIIQETTDTLLDKVQSKQSMDIVADLSKQLPSIVISKIFNVPEKDRRNFIQWGEDISNFWGILGNQDIEDIARKADIGAASFTDLMQRIIKERQEQPGTDMISLLSAAYEQNRLNLDKLPSLCVLILSAGYLTTTDIIPNGVHALLIEHAPAMPAAGYAYAKILYKDAPIEELTSLGKIEQEELSVDGGNIRIRTPIAKPCDWKGYKAVRLHDLQAMAASFQENNLVIDWVNNQPLAPILTYLGDGHDGIWNIVREFKPELERREILDWFHLMENLRKVGGSIQRINTVKGLLWKGKVDDALAIFANCKLKQTENFCAYLEKHRHRIINYQYYQAEEICSIGSGAIESTVKQIDRRTKISGAQWNIDNVPQVLAHRCAYLNGLIFAR